MFEPLSIDPDSPFLESRRTRTSYGELFRFASAVDSFLTEQGLETNDLIALGAPRSEVNILLIASFWLSGRPFVPVSPAWKETEIQGLLKGLDIKGWIGEKNPVIPGVRYFELAKFHKLGFKQSSDSAGSVTNRSIPDAHLFGIFHTSGTASTPKQVPLFRKHIRAAAEASFRNIPLTPGKYWLHAMPLSHIGGISVITRAILSRSGVYYLEDTGTKSMQLIVSQSDKIFGCSVVPTQLKRILDNQNWSPHPEFGVFLLGGGPISVELTEACRLRKIPVLPSFGMTETAAQCIAMPFEKRFTPEHGSCGVPLADVELKIGKEFASDGTLLPYGLLWVRGPQVFEGYTRHELNHLSFDENGWFCTGDFARIDEKTGYVYIEMRRTDRIVSGGENINPFEVENELLLFPEIEEATVVGIDDPEWGQELCAVLTAKNGSPQLKLDEIAARLRRNLAGFKVPKRAIYVDTIPKSASGKVLRGDLQKLFAK